MAEPGPSAGADASPCTHCGQPVPADHPAGSGFCCSGCAAAHAIIGELDLGTYYARRSIDPALRPLRPDEDRPEIDFDGYVVDAGKGLRALHLMIDGLHCPACVWLIESVLGRDPNVIWARVNLSTRRLVVRWRAESGLDANALAGRVEALGYRLMPFDPRRLTSGRMDAEQKRLLAAMAVAGFAAANIMLLSISVWAGQTGDMGPATQGLMHWISALIAIPAVAYAGQPFFRSAVTGLRAHRANMDLPISLAVLLALGMSLFETAVGGHQVYFDSAVALLFFLLIGRYLDLRARGAARGAAENLLALGANPVTVIDGDGHRRIVAPEAVACGMTILVAPGERIGADGRIVDGVSDVDASPINGETVPATLGQGDPVFAGMVNLGAPLRVGVTATGEATLLAEMVRLMERAEEGRARYVALADRVARLYAPAVHGLAIGTFIGWALFFGLPWPLALLNAVAVLIITCPCALGLAVPAVQVVTSGRLLRRGILIKSATALERLAEIDTIVFDKTGTLTEGRPTLSAPAEIDPTALRLAATMCAASRHPLARALTRAAPLVAVARGVRETPGAGLALDGEDGEVRLGSRSWCGLAEDDGKAGPELWLARPGRAPVRFAFSDPPRADARAVIRALRARGHAVALLSGDRATTVAEIAGALGIDDWRADCSPADKVARLAALAAAGHRVLMVGDGLNDAPALAAAHVSLSPASAADISQNAADAIFQGGRLGPVTEILAAARSARARVRQNLVLAFAYNAVAIPLAVGGFVTPLVAALAMSGSSLTVVGNALRPGGGARRLPA